MVRYLIIGSLGQDGVLLRNLLEENNCEVFGVTRPKVGLASHFDSNLRTYYAPFWEKDIALGILRSLRPDVVLHLAAVHGPSGSNTMYSSPELKLMAHRVQVQITENVISYLGTESRESQLILAGSSKMYSGLVGSSKVNEQTVICPIDYYGELKAMSHLLIENARNAGLRTATAIMFNHESALRRKGFLFRDIAREIARVLQNKNSQLELRNANALGDWHSASDTVRGLYLMSLQEHTQDYIFASGVQQSINEIMTKYFWEFHKMDLPNVVSSNQQQQNSSLIGDNSLAKEYLGWKPLKPVIYDLHDIVLQEQISLR